jgi:hypothetical protein
LGFTIEDCLPWSTEELANYYSRKASKWIGHELFVL